jgi:SAM-dependent methyltransferase
MRSDEIRELWRCPVTDSGASADMWDSAADAFAEQPIPGPKDPFLKLMLDNFSFTKTTESLDIGCGCGNYTLALAGRVGRAVGIDISSKMIEYANARAKELGVVNVTMVVADWNSMRQDDALLSGGFDLVFAHLSPAISGAETFEKMISVCRGMCFMTKPIHRKDVIRGEVWKIMGFGDIKEADMEMAYAIELLWCQGYHPYLHYNSTKWVQRRPTADVIRYHMAQVRSFGAVSEREGAEISEYITSIAEGGYVSESISVDETTLYWRVR